MKAKEYRDKYIELMKANGGNIGQSVTDITMAMCTESKKLIIDRGVKKMGGIQSAILEIHQKWISFAQVDKRLPDDMFLVAFKLLEPKVWELLERYEKEYPHSSPHAMQVTHRLDRP